MFTSYWKLILGTATKRTSFWAANKIMIGVAVTGITVGLQHIFMELKWTEVGKILLTALISYVIVLSIAYLVNLIWTPAIIHNAQEESIQTANATIEDLSTKLKPKLESLALSPPQPQT